MVLKILASFAKNLLLFDLGLAVSFNTIVIAALTKKDPNESLEFTIEQASWYGMIY